MDNEENAGNCEKDDYGGSTHSTPQEHKSFAEFAKDKLDSGKYIVDNYLAFEITPINIHLLILFMLPTTRKVGRYLPSTYLVSFKS